MDRRAFVTGLGALLATPLGAEAQLPGKVYRIGILGTQALRASGEPLRLGLRDHGWIEGENFVFVRGETDSLEAYPRVAAELAVNLNQLASTIASLARRCKRMPLILVVEDEVGVAEVIAEALTQLNNDVRVAATAAEALTIAEMDRPDAILLDINLPDASGTSTLDRLRQGAAGCSHHHAHCARG